METLNATQLDTVSLSAAVFSDLITGAAIAAHSKSDLPTLNAVQLSASDGVLTAAATDRYRLIYGETSTETGEGTLAASLVSLPDIKRLAAAIKAIKAPKYAAGPLITLTRAGDILSVSLNGDTLSLNLNAGTFPPYRHLFDGLVITAVETLHLSPSLLASFDKVPAAKGAGQGFTFHGPSKPVTVTIPHDSITWRALLMPMRAAK
jgi:DNA polymerase III sliding clamp (beta) subunit (PCNA family)